MLFTDPLRSRWRAVDHHPFPSLCYHKGKEVPLLITIIRSTGRLGKDLLRFLRRLRLHRRWVTLGFSLRGYRKILRQVLAVGSPHGFARRNMVISRYSVQVDRSNTTIRDPIL